MQWMDILTIVAIIVGPIAAVLITRFLDRMNERKRRQNEILTSLMRTRAARLSAEHVGALNIIQLEFHAKEPIIAAYQNYIEHLSTPLPPVDEQPRFFEQREGLFLTLITEIAKHLHYTFDKRDLGSLSYFPRGWHDQETVQIQNSLMLAELLTGKRTLPITLNQQTGDSPFPPPPE